MHTQHPLWQQLYASIQVEAKKPIPKWTRGMLTTADKAWIEEAGEPSKFDRQNLRAGLLEEVRAGKAHIYVRECDYGRILVLTHTKTPTKRDLEVFDVWGRIFRIFAGTAKPNPKPTALWFAVPAKRQWPAPDTPCGPEHINGGYCTACKPGTIVIYRQEDATRVLIHELLHAFCTDNHSEPLPIVEAKTEAWAELVLAALREAGLAGPRFRGALHAQLAWSGAQNERLRKDHLVRSAEDYAWRYTVGKSEALASMGFAEPAGVVPARVAQASLRLTPPNGPNVAL